MFNTLWGAECEHIYVNFEEEKMLYNSWTSDCSVGVLNVLLQLGKRVPSRHSLSQFSFSSCIIHPPTHSQSPSQQAVKGV